MLYMSLTTTHLIRILAIFLFWFLGFSSQAQLIDKAEPDTVYFKDFLIFQLLESASLLPSILDKGNDVINNPRAESSIKSDSIIIRNFDGSLYRASSYNYKSVENEDGIIYFGNENGLLEFDGAEWMLYQTKSFTPIFNLKLIGDKIYTTGNNELGYFQRNKQGKMVYHSIRDKYDGDKEIREVWFIHEFMGKVYFNSYKTVLVWDGEVLKEFKGTDSHSFKVGGQLLFSVFEKGLAVPDGDTLKYVNTSFKFKDDAAYNILKNRYDEYIIFTSESGFYKLDTTNYETKPWENEINDYFLQDKTYLNSVIRFRDSLFVASTWYKGIIIFNDKGKILQKLDDQKGLNLNYNNYIMADRRSNLWISNPQGINYVKWFNSEENFNFDPATIVTYIDVDDSTLFVKSKEQEFDFSGTAAKAISFYYATPSFTTQDLEYSYFLDGFDETWSSWNAATKKEYTNLPGGEYTFRVRARHNYIEGLSIKPFSLSIILPTPWYLNKWNYLLYSLLVTGLIFGFIRFRTNRLNVANKKLESMVRERTSELVTQKEQLKEANEELKIINMELDNFVYRSSHDLVAPLKSLRGLIQIAQSENKEDAQQHYFYLMNTSINKLEDFIKNIMDFSTNSKKPIELKNIKLDDLLDSIVHDIKYYENSNKVKLIRHYNSDFEIKTDIKRLHIVLSNLLTNAVKYHNYSQHDEPYIKIHASKVNGAYELIVEDNGQGIPEEHHQKIFDMFFRAHQGVEGSGLGLYIVVDTLNILHGKISFTSETRKGTSFKITLPQPS